MGSHFDFRRPCSRHPYSQWRCSRHPSYAVDRVPGLLARKGNCRQNYHQNCHRDSDYRHYLHYRHDHDARGLFHHRYFFHRGTAHRDHRGFPRWCYYFWYGRPDLSIR